MLATLAVISLVVSFVNSATTLLKCCDSRYILDNSLNCVKNSSNNNSNSDETISGVADRIDINKTCSTGKLGLLTDYVHATDTICEDIFQNGTSIILSCSKSNNFTTHGQCDSVLKVLDFWGASMVVLATILYTIPYGIVIIVYCFIPNSQNQAYEKSVISFNVSYTILNSVIIFIGFSELCHTKLHRTTYGILGLILLYFTQACCLWLFIICYDMTLVITRFYWRPSNNLNSDRNYGVKKFRKYSACSWLISSVPTIIAAIFEFNSALPENSPLRPNFSNFHGHHNFAILGYTLFLPISMLLTNTALFIYTTYKMLKIQKDNNILSSNKVKTAKERYLIYLKLYILMDAPWLSGALSAAFSSLWFLKFVRIIQPVLMLIVIIPKQQMQAAYHGVKNMLTKFPLCGLRKRETRTINKNDDVEIT